MSRSVYSLLLVGLSVFSFGWLVSSSSTGQSQEASATDMTAEGDLSVRRAEIFLALQRAKLKQSEALNRRVPNSVSETDLSNLKISVEIGESLLQAVQDDKTDARKSAYLIIAKKSMLSAENELQKAEEVRKQIASRFSNEDIEVLKHKASLAKVNYEIGQQALKRSTEDELRWKIDLLYDEVLKLRNELKQVRGRR